MRKKNNTLTRKNIAVSYIHKNWFSFNLPSWSQHFNMTTCSNWMNLKINNDLKLDITDQQGFILKKKKRFQEVLLFTNFKEGFLLPEDTKEDGYKAEDDGKKEEPFFDKRGSASRQATHKIHYHKGKTNSCKSDEIVFWPKIKGSFIKH